MKIRLYQEKFGAQWDGKQEPCCIFKQLPIRRIWPGVQANPPAARFALLSEENNTSQGCAAYLLNACKAL